MRPEVLPTIVYHIDTPDGPMYVDIDEMDGKPYEVRIRIGKAGLPLRAWCDALANTVNLLLRKDTSLLEIIMAVSELSSYKRVKLPSGGVIRSSPEGLAYVLFSYTRNKKGKEESEGPSLEFGSLSEG